MGNLVGLRINGPQALRGQGKQSQAFGIGLLLTPGREQLKTQADAEHGQALTGKLEK